MICASRLTARRRPTQRRFFSQCKSRELDLHSLRLLVAENKSSLCHASEIFGAPICAHQASRGMRVRPEQQMSEFMGHSVPEHS